MKSLSEIAGLADLNEHPVFSPRNFELVTLGDATLQRQLIESFLKESPATREDLVGAAQAGQDQFGHAVHRLKSGCHFTAADRMLRLLQIINDSDKVKNKEYRMMAAQALLEGIDQLEQALAGVLSERDGR